MITVKDAKFRLFYRGYYIEFGLYGMNEYTVQIDGDDLWFSSVEKAEEFIDDYIFKKGDDLK